MIKPQADPGTLPSSSAPPRASTNGQRWHLQQILLETLDYCVPAPNPTFPSTPPRQLPRSTGATGRFEKMAVVSPITPPSAGSKRPSLDGGDDSASKRVKGKQLFTSPAKPAPNSHVLDKIPTRQRLALDATDEPYLYPDDDDDDIIITKVTVAKPDAASRAVSPTKTSFRTSFGASTVFTKATEQPEYTQSTTVAPPASAAPKLSTVTFQGSTKIPTSTLLPTTPPSQRYRNAGPVGTRPSSASSSEYQTATDRSYRSVPKAQSAVNLPSPVSPPTPPAVQPIQSRQYIPTGPLKDRLQNIWRKLSVKLRKCGDPLSTSL